MNQETTSKDRLEQRLLTLAVGEMMIYGHINRFGASSVSVAIGNLVRKLDTESKIMCFQRRSSSYHEFELVAVGTTPKLHERIRKSIQRYELKVGLIKVKARDTD
jgi:hypothetical protein